MEKEIGISDVLYIIIPAYNEEMNIRRVLDEWYPIIDKHSGGRQSRLCVIDDGSKDHTYQILKEYVKTHPLVRPVTKENEGHGATVLYGYRFALEHGADYIFQTDSDGQTSPEEFPLFWAQRKKYDVIIGHRKKREDGFERVFVTKILKLVIFLTFGIRVADANTPYRLMEKSALKKYIDLVPEKYNLSNILLTIFFILGNEKVKFIPITFRARQGGQNSIDLRKIIKIGSCAIKDFHNIRKNVLRNIK